MKSKAIILAAVCLVLLFALSGCADECDADSDCGEGEICVGGKCVDEVKSSLDIYVGGEEGIVGEFSSPEVLYVDDLISVFSFSVENKGEFTVTKDNPVEVHLGLVRWTDWGVTVGGAYDSDSGTLKATTSFDLQGTAKAGEEVPLPGDSEELTFSVNEGAKVNAMAGTTTKIRATMCYPYQTESTALVCTGTAPKGADPETHCDFQIDDAEVVSSGAPLQITKVSETTSGANTETPTHRFTITVENKGTGVSYLASDITGKNCIMGVDRKVEDKFEVKSITLGVTQLHTTSNCDFTGDKSKQRLIGGKRDIVCSYTYPNVAAAEEPLTVVLSYYYKDEQVKEYVIEG